MEQLIAFNGVKVLLTTGQDLREVQNFIEQADVILSVYPHAVKVLYIAAHLTDIKKAPM